MKRLNELSEESGGKIEPLMAMRKTWRGRSGLSDQSIVNAMLDGAKTGALWHDLPKRYGNWKTRL